MGHITLVTGGAKSGKSAFAEQLALQQGGRLAYIATGQACDAEMRERIARHRERRGEHWQTFEEPLHPARILVAQSATAEVFLLDSLTALVTNSILHAPLDWTNSPPASTLHSLEAKLHTEIAVLIEAVTHIPGHLIVVTDEVGCGVVPDNALARFFRDCLGESNQRLASQADEVWLVAAGLPLCLKPAGDLRGSGAPAPQSPF